MLPAHAVLARNPRLRVALDLRGDLRASVLASLHHDVDARTSESALARAAGGSRAQVLPIGRDLGVQLPEHDVGAVPAEDVRCRHRRQIAGLVGPSLTAQLGASGVPHGDLQPGAALLLVQLGGPADAVAEGRAGSLRDGAQLSGRDGGHLGLEAGQGMGELHLRGGVGQISRLRLGFRRPGWWNHGGSNRAVAR
jgi:hypothetical protein